MIKNPSKYQADIFDWFENPVGSIAVDAKAGSGKTSTLVHGLNLMPKNADRKLFAAFNKSIVEELTSRLPRSVNSQTFHSIGFAATKLNFPAIKRWDVNEGNLKYRKMARNIQVSGDFDDKRAVQDAVLSLLNYAQVTLTPLDEPSLLAMADRFGVQMPDGFDVSTAARVVAEMLEHGKQQLEHGLISFSDMIYMPAALGLTMPQYDFIAVDEAQDLNRAQMTLIQESLASGGSLISVGDPNQSIYMFAGAESDSFNQMTSFFDSTTMPLNYCYRCPQAVIAEAQKIVPSIECPEGTPEGKVAWLSDKEFKNELKSGDMVLCRLTAPLVKLCFQLLRQRIPAKIKGRDIGENIANKVKQIMKREVDMGRFPQNLYSWRDSQLELLRAKFGSEDQQQNVEDITAVLEICFTTFNPHSVSGFMEDIKLLFNDGASPITLCTVHRAKGLENDRVFIVRPDKLPLSRKGMTAAQSKQEMNLKYVAITRAKKELYFVHYDPTGEDGEDSSTNPGIPGITI